jgi:hypothetical protein
MANAKQIIEAQNSTIARMYNRGEAITTIMQRTGKSYRQVKEVIDLAGCPARRPVVRQ